MNRREFEHRYLVDPKEIRIAEAEGIRVHDEIERAVRDFGFDRKVDVVPNEPVLVVDGRQRVRAAKKFLEQRAVSPAPQGGNRRQRRAAMRKMRKR